MNRTTQQVAHTDEEAINVHDGKWRTIHYNGHWWVFRNGALLDKAVERYPVLGEGNATQLARLLNTSNDLLEALKLYFHLCGNTAYQVDRLGLKIAFNKAEAAISKAETGQ